jgi:hypothetical protein
MLGLLVFDPLFVLPKQDNHHEHQNDEGKNWIQFPKDLGKTTARLGRNLLWE